MIANLDAVPITGLPSQQTTINNILKKQIEINVEIQHKKIVKKTYKCKIENVSITLSMFRESYDEIIKDVLFKKEDGLIPKKSEEHYTIGQVFMKEKYRTVFLTLDEKDEMPAVPSSTQTQPNKTTHAPATITTTTTITTVPVTAKPTTIEEGQTKLKTTGAETNPATTTTTNIPETKATPTPQNELKSDDSQPKLNQKIPDPFDTSPKDNTSLTRIPIDVPKFVEIISALKLKQTVDSNFQSNLGAIKWDLNEATISIPEDTFTTDLLFTYNELQHIAYKSGIYQGGGKISRALKVTADVKASFSHEKLSQKKKGTIYLHSYYNVPRLELNIPKDKITLDPNFLKQLKASKSPIQLNQLFQFYGAEIPTRFVLGGKLTFDDKREVINTLERERSLKSFGAEVNASLQYVSVGSNIGATREKDNRLINISEFTNASRTILGGDPTKSNNLNTWMDTLKDSTSWSIIQKDKFISIWDIIEQDQELHASLKEISGNFLTSVNIISSYNKSKNSKLKTISSVQASNLTESLCDITPKYKDTKKPYLNICLVNPNDSNNLIEQYNEKESFEICQSISSNHSSREGWYMIIFSHGNIFSKLENEAKNLLKSFDSSINSNFSFIIICKIKKGVPFLKISQANKKANTYLSLNLN